MEKFILFETLWHVRYLSESSDGPQYCTRQSRLVLAIVSPPLLCHCRIVNVHLTLTLLPDSSSIILCRSHTLLERRLTVEVQETRVICQGDDPPGGATRQRFDVFLLLYLPLGPPHTMVKLLEHAAAESRYAEGHCPNDLG